MGIYSLRGLLKFPRDEKVRDGEGMERGRVSFLNRVL
jgi:hypothetical protein